jgi:hypothetical protein
MGVLITTVSMTSIQVLSQGEDSFVLLPSVESRQGGFSGLQGSFEMKNVLTGTDRDACCDNVPPDGVISLIIRSDYNMDPRTKPRSIG